MNNKFSKEVMEELKHYVYIYSDPDTREIFYVGKGKGSRVFHHMNEETDSEKYRKIQDIRERGCEYGEVERTFMVQTGKIQSNKPVLYNFLNALCFRL